MLYYENVVGAVEILFCQNKCVLFLLSTAIIWGPYLPLMQCRTILHQLCEGQCFPPINTLSP